MSPELPNLVLTAIGAGTWDWDIRAGTIRHNEVLAQLLGLPEAQREHPFPFMHRMMHPEDRARAQALFDAALATGEAVSSTHRLVLADGRTIWVEDIGRVVARDAEGRPLRMVGAIRDVTAQVETRERLHAAETLLADLVASVPGVLFRYRQQPDGREAFSFVSSRSAEIWEMTPEEVMADPAAVWALLDPADRERMRDAALRPEAALLPRVQRFGIVTRSGRKKRLQSLGSPVPQADGSVVWNSLVLDVTEQERVEQELTRSRELLLRAQKLDAIGSLTGGMAHDFNNILAVILGNLELLEEDRDPKRAQSYLREAVAATLRGRDLTRALLSFARKATLEPVTMDVNAVVAGLDTMIRRTLPATIRLDVSLMPDLWRVRADRNATESTILNLVINARDAMPEGGQLTIETSNVRLSDEYVGDRDEGVEPGPYVMIAVTDTGTGIPPDVLPRVFEPFFTTKPVGQGTGLGLSMVMGFTRQSGGTVRIYSEPGHGTTVKVYLKAVDGDLSAAFVPERAGVMSGPHGRVLLVEDEEAVRRMMRQRLAREGFEVVEAANGPEALRRFEAEGPFDIVLTDIVMPGNLQGPALTAAIRRLDPHVPVVFMSGYPAEAAIHGNWLKPEDIRVMKPVSRDDLLIAMQRALKRG